MRALTFAESLRRARKAAGLSQEKLADLARLSRNEVSAIERGLILIPHHDTVTRLADVLGLETPEREHLRALARSARQSDASVPPHPPASLAPPLVGREHELVFVGSLLTGQGPPALFFHGEPGIGKSRLLAEATKHAQVHGWQVINGGCTRRSGQEPYEPWVSAFGRQLATSPVVVRREHLRGCTWLVRLLPELAEQHLVPLPTWTLPAEQERRLMFQAVARYLANRAGPAGTLLVLDDLQWAGDDAIALLAHLIWRTEDEVEQPLRLIGAYRTTEVRPPHALHLLLADLTKDALANVQALPQLGREDARTLFTSLWSEESQDGREPPDEYVQDEVLRRADGLPFFVVSSVRALQAGMAAEQVPVSLADSVRARVTLLPDAAHDLLGIAAIAGRVVSGALLLATSEYPEGEALDMLDLICHAGLLVEDAEDRYRFTHDLIREVIQADLGTSRRRVLLRKVAEELVRHGGYGHTADIAYHFYSAGELTQALPFLLQAGDQATKKFADGEAEAHYRRAAECAQCVHDQHREAEAFEKLTGSLLRLARFSDAITASEASLSAYQTVGDGEGESRLAHGILQAHLALATPQRGVARLLPLLEELSERGLSPLGRARLHHALARLLVRSGSLSIGEESARHLSDALTHAERAIALAGEAQDQDMLVRAMNSRFLSLVWLGRSAEATIAIEELLPRAEGANDLQELCNLFVEAQAGCEIRGEFLLSQQYLDRALSLCGRIGDQPLAAHAWNNQAELAYYRGDWEVARSAIERSLEVVKTYRLGHGLQFSPLRSSQLYLVAGENEKADAIAAASLALAHEQHDMQALRMTYNLLAERDLLAGHPEAVRAYLEPLLDQPGWVEFQVLFILPQFAWALLAVGDAEGAEASAMQACARARAGQYFLWLVDGLWALALVHTRQERWPEAARDLDEAITLCRQMPYPYAEAKALWVYGQLHAAQGEPERAREAYQQALAICERLGEGMYRPHIEQALAAL